MKTFIHKIPGLIKILILVAVIILGGSFAIAHGAWTNAPSNPPDNNVEAPINVGSSGQIKAGGLTVATDAVTTGFVVANGNVGIGALTPATKLDVMGGLLGGNAGNTINISNQYGYVGNAVQFITRLIRTSAGGDWNTASIQLLRRTDATDQSSITLGPGGVGIGTNTPSYPLQVNGWALISGGNGVGDNASRIGLSNAGVIWWVSNNTDGKFAIHQGSVGDRFNIDTSGNVGINTASPAASLKLAVNGNVGATAYCDINGANCITPGGVTTGATPSLQAVTEVGATTDRDITLTKGVGGSILSSNKLNLQSASGNALYLNPFGGNTPVIVGQPGAVTNDLTVTGKVTASEYYNTNSGNVIQGNDEWLRLNQYDNFSSGVHIPGFFNAGTTNGVTIGNLYSPVGAGNLVVQNNASAASFRLQSDLGYLYEGWGMRFGSPDTQHTFQIPDRSLLVGYAGAGQNWGSGNIYASGKIGIGTTDPSVELDVNGSIRIRNGTYLSSDGNLNIQSEASHPLYLNPWGGTNVYIGVPNGATQSLTVTGNTYSSAFFYSSDKNLKKNIQPLQDSLSKIMQLKGVSFDWKKDGKASVGLIAQDVEKVYPELVDTNADTGLKSVEYGNLVAPLIEAVKEQQKQIEDLKVQINELKNKK